jgi:predicted nuclease of predicted toxin-antitoxin system
VTTACFLVDECLSPELAQRLAKLGYDATSNRDRAKLGKLDSLIFEYAVQEDRIIVTQNADDFRNLVGNAELHPGLIILTANSIQKSWEQLERAIKHVSPPTKLSASATGITEGQVIHLERREAEAR